MVGVIAFGVDGVRPYPLLAGESTLCFILGRALLVLLGLGVLLGRVFFLLGRVFVLLGRLGFFVFFS